MSAPTPEQKTAVWKVWAALEPLSDTEAIDVLMNSLVTKTVLFGGQLERLLESVAECHRAKAEVLTNWLAGDA